MPIIVQVKKDKNETKGARISTDLNIAGKYTALIRILNLLQYQVKLKIKKRLTG